MWIHSHVEGNKCGFSSTDIQTQFAYEQMVPNILGCVFEVGKTKIVKYDFFKLTAEGKDRVKTCQKSATLHSSCFGRTFYEIVPVNVISSLQTDIVLNIIDARENEGIHLQISSSDNDIQIKCNQCKMFCSSSNIMRHLNKRSKCSHQMKTQTIEYIQGIAKTANKTKRLQKSKQYEAGRKCSAKTIAAAIFRSLTVSEYFR